MARTITDIQKRSDERRGLKVKSMKLNVETIALLERLAAHTGEPQSAVVTKALQMLANELKL
ncbi:hypothetical protein CYR40_03595 [Chimaeribacter arupi]|uniref:Ribbon-helix-helix protein, CopG family n=1 Tax=Nissabacter archeti TaxID=1917880 RepID=A0ABS5JKY2_9GAMM|nr:MULTISPECIES: hypothetical protein [Yersiniaceae]MBS0969983.1 hypothetical protein [Nissabacter archeti]PLR40027.1 hypothetical protein CYR23_01425 [Chimaeribacter arupi]PLR49567.1 hypothetical protein CYR40_03595 [Chimaeribacter arupi]PLR51360.1 hypothetical protein CYR52_09755 [Chimaeribacter arupi]